MDLTKLTEQVSKIKVKNVVDMPLFYGLWILAFGIISSVFSKYEWVTVVLFIFAGVLLLLAAFGYLYFTFRNPDYLRSEEYHIKKQSLEILGDKENYLPVDGKNIVEISNPNMYQLTEGKKEDSDD